MRGSYFALVLVVVCCLKLSLSLNNGLARTPPMGWLAWERFRCNIDCKNDPNFCISEKLFTEMADAMIAHGLKDVGYEFINIDDCWAAKSRDSNGRLQADPERFPRGIPYLSAYMHERGLKLGIYGDYGNLTCGGYPGSLYHMKEDADTFAKWQVDMVKLDGCNVDVATMNTGYPEFGQYLNKTGRPMVYSCSWPDYMRIEGMKIPWASIAEHCNLWRLYDDIQDSWESVSSIINFWGTNQSDFAPFAGPGQWNDPDMLIIGDFSLSFTEAKTQMAIWAIVAAPLLVSSDLRTISPEMLSILKNKEIIEVNQDPLGKQGLRVYNSGGHQIWARDLHDGTKAVALVNFNSDGTPAPVTLNFQGVGSF